MTVGWIRESDEDRFYEAMSRVPDPTPWHPPPEKCPFCTLAFESIHGLYDHLHETHIVQRPVLLLAGQEPKAVDFIGTAVDRDDILISNCDSALVSRNGGPPVELNLAALQQRLSTERDATLAIKLTSIPRNQAQVEQLYKLRVCVASDVELGKVDRAFVKWFGNGGPHISTVDDYLEETGDGPFREYAEAMTNYMLGALHKDKDPATGVRPPFRDYTHFYRRSLDVLTMYRRPLPFLLASLIRFALNDFSRIGRSGFELLDLANRTLGPLAGSVSLEGTTIVGDTDDAAKAVCPVDSGTSLVLSEISRAVSISRWSAVEEEAIDLLEKRSALGALDLAKLRAVHALNAARLGQPQLARHLLEGLTFNDCFARWAEQELENT